MNKQIPTIWALGIVGLLGLLVAGSLLILTQRISSVSGLQNGAQGYEVPQEIWGAFYKPSPVGPEERPDRGCWLKRKGEDDEITIFDSPNCNLPIIAWQKNLIFPERRGDGSIVLIALNPNTGEKRALYDQSERISDFSSRIPTEIFLSVISEKLFFSLSSYMASSAIYAMGNLEGEPRLIFLAKESADIRQQDDRYWIVGGFGDVCVSNMAWRPFNPATETVGDEIRVRMDCGNGEVFLGADAHYAYIARSEGSALTDEYELKSIYARRIANPSETVEIISEKNMYSRTKNAVFHPPTNQFFLLTEEGLVSRQLTSSKYTRVLDISPDNSYLTKVGRNICVSDNERFDVPSKTLVWDEEGCSRGTNFEEMYKEAFDGVSLSQEYIYQISRD